MTHRHEHDAAEDDGEIFGHHDARYNADKIINNLLLIQDHYTFDPCADCLTKHWKLVIAYAEEGLTLDNNEMVRKELKEAHELADRHLGIIIKCTVGDRCDVKGEGGMMKLVQEVRTLRRRLNVKLYGLEGDITHDITDDEPRWKVYVTGSPDKDVRKMKHKIEDMGMEVTNPDLLDTVDEHLTKAQRHALGDPEHALA